MWLIETFCRRALACWNLDVFHSRMRYCYVHVPSRHFKSNIYIVVRITLTDFYHYVYQIATCFTYFWKVNIMMKNVVDVVLGGVSYWAIGYGLSYGSDTVSVYEVWIFRENLFNHVLIFVVGKILILLLMEDLFLGDKYVLWLGILVCGWFWSDDWPHIHYLLLSGPLLTSISFYCSEIYYLRSIHSWVVKTSL